MTKDKTQMIQALRDRVGLSEDDAKRTVEVVDEVLAHEQAQQRKAAPLRLDDSNPFKDAVVTERTGLVSRAVSSLRKYGMLWYAKNWTAQAGVGVD